jgi:tRNA(fMet)-specific endonuclease VapC
MTRYVLDTDIAGLLQTAHTTVVERLRQLPASDSVVTTIITFGEDLSGWMPACRRAHGGVARARAYDHLRRGLDFYRAIICLPFDTRAASVFDRLRAQRPRVGTNDLGIAAITLSVGGVLVTRNTGDFQRISGLTIEDWSKEIS